MKIEYFRHLLNFTIVGTLSFLFHFCRPTLPEFHLDFGYMVYGLVASKTVTLTNTGWCPVSFATAHTALQGTGFSVDLGDKVRSLPGAPDFEELEFVVRFDPASIKYSDGPVEALLPFNVTLCISFIYMHK